jgi:hypothetical protein
MRHCDSLNAMRPTRALLFMSVFAFVGCQQAGPALREDGQNWTLDCPTGQTCILAGHYVEGTLHGEGSCAWLSLDDGRKVRLLWPPGWKVIWQPGFEVHSPDGRVSLRDGEVIAANGGDVSPSPVDDCARSGVLAIDQPEPVQTPEAPTVST